MEGSEELYKRGKVFVIITVIVIFIIIGIISLTNQNKETSTNAVNTNNSIGNYSKTDKFYNEERINENPYEITNDYDGIYKFVLPTYNGNYSTGVITFNNGECKIKYERTSDLIKEYSGFCGINKEDNSSFYFVINDDDSLSVRMYQGILNGGNLFCKLKSEYDITGNSNSELILTYLEKSYNLDTTLKKVINEEKIRIEEEKKLKEEQKKQAFISSCQTYTFEQLARNPENFRGTNVKLTGEVVQVMEGSYSNSLRVNITKKGTYSTYYTDTIYVNYTPKAGEDKILEDDIITIYGTAQGDYSYTSTMGASITLPYISAKYIVLQK